ncbi:molybdenum cofactor guanylyltransferase [Salinibacter altiplanensis]|uniref:molybdenum cofactor guanylyltransferase n=1 Tax=Salinibacter altiplanensis TaxID=1803181 RepID=UPI000C9EEE25|nr:molybdenum cofactor guanylyltransferase [Salinibacter altiplanensis]
MSVHDDVTGLVLAGGQSRRFGTDKARHRVDGRPMIARVYATVRAVARPVWVSVQRAGDRYDDVLPEGVRHVTDSQPETGPLAGLLAGSRAAETTWLLAVSCDLPYLTADVLRSLLDARVPSVDVVVPETPDGRCHPLCALYRQPTVEPVIETLLAEERRAVRALLHRLNTDQISVPAAPLRNVNRKDDL